MESHTPIGDTGLSVAPFSTRKARAAGRAVARMSKKLPEIINKMADFNDEYRKRHTTVITREMTMHPMYRESFKDFTVEDWERINNKIEMPRDASDEEQFAAAFDIIFDLAEEELLRVLALAIMPNDELKEAARSGDKQKVEELYKKYMDKIDDETSPGDLVTIALAAASELREEFDARKEDLGKLREMFRRTTQDENGEDGEMDLEETPSNLSSEKEATGTSSRTSSTTSPGEDDTDGNPEPSLTTPPGDSSDDSEPALSGTN